jgi:DNA helicase-2/ATP-dependent DNA helicase PcrA
MKRVAPKKQRTFFEIAPTVVSANASGNGQGTQKSASDLTPAQRAAVEHASGPLLIIAGAGTGKTKAITERLTHLLNVQKLQGEQILAVTFSNKATEEMEQRLDRLMPIGYDSPWINTFHAFGERVLRENALALGLAGDFKVLSPAQQQLFIREHLFAFELDYYRPLGNPTKFVAALASHFSRAKDEAINPARYTLWAKEQLAAAEKLSATNPDRNAEIEEAKRGLEVATAFATYEKLLHEEGNIDVADLIALTLRLFETRPSILARYRRQFKAILVDEFQDTNLAQYRLIKLLAAPLNNLTVVADDDQAIYRWRGASVANVLLFMQDFPGAKKISLRENFRSLQPILDAAYYSVQENNPNRLEVKLSINKHLTAVRGKGVAPVHYQAATREHEIAHVIRLLVARHQSGLRWSDMAILVRSNAAADPLLAALTTSKIPFHFVMPRGLFSRPEVLDLLAFLRTVADLRDSISLFRLLKSQARFKPLELVALLHLAKKSNLSLYEVLDDISQSKITERIEPATKEAAEKVVAQLDKYVTLSQEKSVGQVLFAYVEEQKLFEKLLKSETTENTEKILNINQFFRRVVQFEREAEDKTPRGFIEHVELLQASGENVVPADVDASPDAVQVSTVHGSKGLEFPVVILYHLLEQHFPSVTRRDAIPLPPALVSELPQDIAALSEKELHMAEERRLFYVGCTRARDELILTSCIDDGGVRKRKTSRFVSEAKIETLPTPELAPLPSTERAKKRAPLKLPLPKRFSYTQLTVFDTCPLQYKFAHMYKIPSLGSPTFSYGKSIHETLAAFHQLILPDQPHPTKEKLLELLDHYWINEWYHSKKHEQERKAAAVQALGKYYDENHEQFAPSIWIERDYNLRIGPYSIVGRVDRADELPDGTLEIIDYKTGAFKDEAALKKNNQLALYALAAQKVFKKTASKLTWYFIDAGKKVTTQRSPEELKALEVEVQSKIQEIIKSDFLPTPSFSCKFCDFKNICEAGQASGYV